MMNLDTLPNRLEEALASAEPRAALQGLANNLLATGAERDDLLPALRAYRQRLVQQGRAEQADLLDELIDGFTGWCRLE